ncbi:MAG: hypothetical protein U0228_34940 [Myxococcaceae bacterium]
MIKPILVASCAVVVLCGCDQKSDAPEEKAPKEKAATKTPEKAAEPAGPKVGINLPGNDPKVVELAKKVLTCKFEKDFDSNCAEYKAWKDESGLFADNKADATLVAFLEDTDEKVVALGISKLRGWDGGAFADKALAGRILAVAEKSVKGKPALGEIVGHLKVKETETFPRIKALMANEELGDIMRGDILYSLLRTNPDSDDVFALEKGLLDDARLGRSAFSGFTNYGDEKACPVYLATLENKDDYLSSRSAEQIASQPCKAQLDAMLKSIEGHLKAKKVTDIHYCDALTETCKSKEASAAQKKKALGLSHKIAEDKTNKAPSVRGEALEAALACDEKGGKKYLGKFLKDADKDVAEKAAKLTAK